MKKYEILYDWPIRHLTLLTESPEAELFANALDEDNQDEFVKLTERIRGFRDDLVQARVDRILFKDWEALDLEVENFVHQFGTFPNLKPMKFRISLLLSDKFVQAVPAAAVGLPEIDEGDIQEEMFELRELAEPLPVPWFVQQNARSFSDSIVIFSSADLKTLKHEVTASNISPELLLQLLATLHASADVPTSYAALIKKEDPAIQGPAVEAFARLVILSSGKPVHSPRSYVAPPAVIDRDSFRAGIPYHQLNDIFDVLSEYNSRHEVLTKYLTLYHVIENFMFKLPIVELEREKDGEMFSIRDFQRLYARVDEYELPSLKRLFSATLQLPAAPGTSFERHVLARWRSLVPGTSKADIEKALVALNISKNKRALKYSEFKNDVTGNFSQLIYSVRNAIVHNKETEFHLTYATLDKTISTLIELFLIPSLEEICFALVGTQNPYVWYAHREMLLYK